MHWNVRSFPAPRAHCMAKSDIPQKTGESSGLCLVSLSSLLLLLLLSFQEASVDAVSQAMAASSLQPVSNPGRPPLLICCSA